MKILFPLIIASLAIVSTVSAATGSTSTGSTSTGSTIKVVASCNNCGNGGPIRGFNITTQNFEMVPQCFPWAWLTFYTYGNISMIYENQKACQEQRLIDFGI